MITNKDLLNAFSGDIEQVKVTSLYKATLSLIAFIMVLLPIIYLGIVILAAWGVVFFVQDPMNVFSGTGGGFGKLIQYSAPVVVNALIVVFMVKPFFVKLNKPAMGIEISREEEPVLFEFIDMICHKVNSPVPTRVLLNSEANAAAKFGDGLGAFLKGELELVIGLPLVSSMSASQLGGVLAHEFGHFSQGAGMRISFIVRTISGWFFRVVFERDKWDDRINSWSSGGHVANMLVFGLARIGIWISRKLLHGLLILGNLISAVMLRQMEFDADRYEIRFAGSDEFINTTKNLSLISVNMAIVHQNIFENWSNRKLNNNISSFLESKVNNAEAKLIDELDKVISESKTGFFDTHPCDKDRIENARKENSGGIFKLNKPAKELFIDFDKQSVRASVHFYKTLMQEDFKEDYLVSLDEYAAKDHEIEQNNKALVEFFGEAITGHFPINFKKNVPEKPLEEPLPALKKIQIELTSKSEESRKIIEAKFELLDKLMNWEGAYAIVKVGGKIQAKAFGLKKGKLKDINEQLDQAKEQEKEFDQNYRSLAKYIEYVPQLLRAVYSEDTETLKRVDKLIDCESNFAEHYEHSRKIMRLHNRFFILAINMESLGGDKGIVDGFAAIASTLKEELRKSYTYFLKVENPFEPGKSVAEIMFPDGVDKIMKEQLPEIYQTYYQLYHLNYARIVGELGVLALSKVERD